MKDIVGYEGLYGIEEDGRVWSYRRKCYLKQLVDRGGYYYQSLYKDGIVNNFRNHRLIAITYIPNPDNKPVIDHINRIRTDNRIENLRWVTFAENSHNSSTRSDSLLKQKNISYRTDRDLYRLKIIRYNITHVKYFKTEQEAIDYRDEYLKTISQS